jgi:hypothetical protein
MTRFPAMRAHEGIWEGTYRHLDVAGRVEDEHTARVVCDFPDDGQVFYCQTITFIWADGRKREAVFEGVIRGDAVWFDTPAFHGKGWETHDGLILLNLARKDEAGANFFEIICMGKGGQSRARTWHWFRKGALYRRTLCDEVRVG